MKQTHWLILATIGWLAACSTIVERGPQTSVDGGVKWVMLPMQNHTETPQAGRRAEAITEALLRLKGVRSIDRYPAQYAAEDLLQSGDDQRIEQARRWAAGQGAAYGVTGTVDEWRYKVGVDGEPAVGVTLTVIDLKSGAVVWNAVGSKSGWSRESVNGVGQELLSDLLASLRVGK